MKRFTLLCYLLPFMLLLGPLLGCSRADADTKMLLSTPQESLLVLEKEWAAVVAAGDTSRAITYWTDDAINYSPGTPPVVGKQALQRMIQRNRSQPGFSIRFSPTQAYVAEMSDLGYTSGTFQRTVMDPTGAPITRSGNYVNIWKKQPDGSWKCAITIGTPSG